MNLNLTNNSTSSYVPRVDLNVVGITSASGTVSVRNADNGGNGTSSASPALFGYSSLLGADETFSPAETTGSRTLQFNDSAAEMFTFDIAVTAHQQTGVEAVRAPGVPVERQPVQPVMEPPALHFNR